MQFLHDWAVASENIDMPKRSLWEVGVVFEKNAYL